MPASAGPLAHSAQLLFVFGATRVLQDSQVVESIRGFYPAAHILGCSTAGEIAPFSVGERSELHNQTTTITTFSEC
ncbi:MAG: FIST N-terminal domain-containing protein [Steroidobacteraceae bacterium]|jgi:hypothetical protein